MADARGVALRVHGYENREAYASLLTLRRSLAGIEMLGRQTVTGPRGLDGGFLGNTATATRANHCHGQVAGKAKLAGTVNDLSWSMAIDEGLGDNDTRTQISNLGLGLRSHRENFPFY